MQTMPKLHEPGTLSKVDPFPPATWGACTSVIKRVRLLRLAGMVRRSELGPPCWRTLLDDESCVIGAAPLGRMVQDSVVALPAEKLAAGLRRLFAGWENEAGEPGDARQCRGELSQRVPGESTFANDVHETEIDDYWLYFYVMLLRTTTLEALLLAHSPPVEFLNSGPPKDLARHLSAFACTLVKNP